MDRRKVIFISGPMSGYEDYNRAAFNAAEKKLAGHGYTVLNPAVLPDGLEHGEYMRICLAMLEQADGIYMLDGWEKSKGAKLEFERASSLRMVVDFQGWNGLSAYIAGMHSDGRHFMRYGIQAMHDYFVDREASSAVAGQFGHDRDREAIAYCKHFIGVLDSIGVADGESH